jgi:hypothetical protein
MENYEAGLDQNQGVVGTMARNQQHEDTELVGSRVPRMDPNVVTEQGDETPTDEETPPQNEAVDDAGDVVNKHEKAS